MGGVGSRHQWIEREGGGALGTQRPTEVGLRSSRLAACSHGWHGLKVTKDGSVLEIDDGSWLRGRGRGQQGTPGP
jgi:hypothetical protein